MIIVGKIFIGREEFKKNCIKLLLNIRVVVIFIVIEK